jgi:hypothetical protein
MTSSFDLFLRDVLRPLFGPKVISQDESAPTIS